MSAKKLIKQYRRHKFSRQGIELTDMLINIKSRCPGYSYKMISILKNRRLDRYFGQKDMIIELFQDWCDSPNTFRPSKTGSKTYQENGKFYSMQMQDPFDLPF